MGLLSTKEENRDIDTTGSVNTNVVIGHTVDISNDYLLILLSIICVIKIMEILYFIYNGHIKKIKKRVQNI